MDDSASLECPTDAMNAGIKTEKLVVGATTAGGGGGNRQQREDNVRGLENGGGGRMELENGSGSGRIFIFVVLAVVGLKTIILFF
jgi:hypothetical protein